MVPPWTPPLPPDTADVGSDDGSGQEDPAPQTAPVAPVAPIPVAAPARFRGTRRSLGDYVRSGDGRELRRSLGHYVRSGYGGAGTATRRFGGTVTTADALGGMLARVAAGEPAPPGSVLDPIILSGRSAQEIMDAVVEAVRPVDGTQDAEADRASIRDALSELLTLFPEADLLNLDPEQRTFAIERFTANSVFRRFDLDTGKTIIEKAPSVEVALARLKEIRNYIKQSVAAAFRKLRDAGRGLTSGRIGWVVRRALEETFAVFEAYSE